MVSFRGFTIVELLIAITVMLILAALGTVALQGVQANARDDERKTDIEAIARGLEQYYNRGDWRVVGASTKGSYPGTRDFVHFMGTNMCDQNGQSTSYYASGQCSVPDGYATDVLPGVTKNVLLSPSNNQIGTNWWCDDACLTTNLTNTDFYVYRPFNSLSGGDPTGWCFHNCPRYELWYKSEVTNTIIKIKSRHQ